MSERVVVLGAGFGGLELCTVLSEAVRRPASPRRATSSTPWPGPNGWPGIPRRSRKAGDDRRLRGPFKCPPAPSECALLLAKVAEKERFGSSRRARWYGG